MADATSSDHDIVEPDDESGQDYKALYEEFKKRADGQNRTVQQLQKERETLLQQLQGGQEPPATTAQEPDRIAQLEAVVRQMELERVRAEVVRKYPHAKEFADMLDGESAEQVEALAKTLHERVERLGGGAKPSDIPAPPGADVAAGGQGGEPGPSRDDQVEAALDSRNWTEYLRLKSQG